MLARPPHFALLSAAWARTCRAKSSDLSELEFADTPAEMLARAGALRRNLNDSAPDLPLGAGNGPSVRASALLSACRTVSARR